MLSIIFWVTLNRKIVLVEKFRPWIRFLNEHQIFKNSICLNAPLKITPLFLMCSTAEVSSDSNSFIFTVDGTPYLVDETVFKTVLNFPTDNFIDKPSDDQMIKFFNDINYSGVLDLTRLNKNLLVSEWYCFFDIITKVFANCTQKNFNILTSLVQNIGYAIVYNQRIDIGKILWGIIMYRYQVCQKVFR